MDANFERKRSGDEKRGGRGKGRGGTEYIVDPEGAEVWGDFLFSRVVSNFEDRSLILRSCFFFFEVFEGLRLWSRLH